jgi:adenine deaminase
MEIAGRVVNLEAGTIEAGVLEIEAGKIVNFRRSDQVPERFILPGFIDAHVHIESSMLPPSEFARLAVVHGTVATVSDPHEIANVLGSEGIDFMISDGARVPFKFFFGAPPCVPATTFETSGAELNSALVAQLLTDPQILYLAEMMNYPGVIFRDPEVLEKLASARALKKPIDGHAPGLRGEDLQVYAAAGISTDHECFSLAEAKEKLALGMKILIREGSAAKNFEELYSLVDTDTDQVMLCSDDKHPNDLVDGHINTLVLRLLAKGIDIFKALRVACLNPIQHYKLPVGLCRVGDSADFIVVDSLQSLKVLETYVAGVRVAQAGSSLIPRLTTQPINNFKQRQISLAEIRVKARSQRVRVIEALDGQIVTGYLEEVTPQCEGDLISDPERDLLKIAVVNRYHQAPIALGLVKNFGLKRGAIASTVAHDSHNIIVVGANDKEIVQAVNQLMKSKGGVIAVSDQREEFLPLSIAGLMSQEDGYQVAERYSVLDSFAKELGSKLTAPFMTLSFLALLVIPRLKLSDRGLFDGEKFEFVDLFV